MNTQTIKSLDLRKKLNIITDSEGNVFTAEKVTNGYIVNCKGKNDYFCFANDVKEIFAMFMFDDNQKAITELLTKLLPVKAEPVKAGPVKAEPVKAEPVKAEPVLTINQILKNTPKFILAVNYDAGSLADMLGEHDRDDNSSNEYLAEMTIQYHSLTDDACLSFTTECLVSLNDNKVTIEQMNTSPDIQAVYANNIKELTSINGNSVNVWGGDVCDAMHTKLLELIESQPIDDIPEHFIIESY